MAHHLYLNTARLLHDTQERPKHASKRSESRRSFTHARNLRGQLGRIKQSIRRKLFFLTKNTFATGALATVGILVWFLMPLGKDLALADLLTAQGYWETIPPADYYLPGTINTIEVRSDGSIAIYPTCKIDPALLSTMTLHSHTVDRTLAERLNKEFDISDRIKGTLPVGMEGHKAKRLTLSLQNSSILQISDEELLLVRKEIIKDSCQEAIEWNINNGATVCQTRAALMGDLVYNITYEDGVSGHAGTTGSSRAAETSQGTADRIEGKGLIYGVSFVPHGISPRPEDCQVISKKKA